MTTAHPRPLKVVSNTTKRIKDEEAPYVMARLAERLMEKEYVIVFATMEEVEEGEVYTIMYRRR
jgi:hypothetical protein